MPCSCYLKFFNKLKSWVYNYGLCKLCHCTTLKLQKFLTSASHDVPNGLRIHVAIVWTCSCKVPRTVYDVCMLVRCSKTDERVWGVTVILFVGNEPQTCSSGPVRVGRLDAFDIKSFLKKVITRNITSPIVVSQGVYTPQYMYMYMQIQPVLIYTKSTVQS